MGNNEWDDNFHAQCKGSVSGKAGNAECDSVDIWRGDDWGIFGPKLERQL